MDSVSSAAVEDFILASKVNLALLNQGHVAKVTCEGGKAIVVVDKFVIRMGALEKEIAKIVGGIPGVTGCETRLGPNARADNPYSPFNIELPAKVLLVDDERDFIEALSERLRTRHIGSGIVYNGEEALSLLEREEPEVMVLDLRMPGIDGIEVLRRVKQEHPQVEVIILTGHGSEREKELAKELGAFAYLEKPTDIDVLTETMKNAHRLLKDKKARESAPKPETS